MTEAETGGLGAVPALEVVGVSHSFGAVRALDGVSLAVGTGEFVALLGMNGAGKTTLFSLITRLYDNVSGSVAVRGHDLRRAPGAALAELGVVFQTRALDGDLTVRQNLAYHAGLHGLSRAKSAERSAALAEEMGLGQLLGARVSKLSGGQVCRAEIARALLHRPRFLLLDEPTVGLDLQARRDLLRLVRGMVGGGGVGVLWATHLFDDLDLEDRVVLLHHGRVLADARARDLADGGSLEEAFLRLTGIDRAEVLS